MITATPFLASAADAKLEDWGPLDEATGDPMHTSGTTLWTGEGDQEAGVWECTAGPSRWSLENNEFVHILSGRMTVTPDGGEPADSQDASVLRDAGLITTRRQGSAVLHVLTPLGAELLHAG
jgi:uncharacterized cupin superfamily protein